MKAKPLHVFFPKTPPELGSRLVFGVQGLASVRADLGNGTCILHSKTKCFCYGRSWRLHATLLMTTLADKTYMF
jgi:hypothetical protein